MIILTFILLFILVSAFIDYEHISSNQYIENHYSRWFLRCIFILAVSRDLSDLIGMSLLFSALFDGVLNAMRGRELLYLGKVALWDRFWGKIPFLYIIFKVVSLFVGIYLCVI